MFCTLVFSHKIYPRSANPINKFATICALFHVFFTRNINPTKTPQPPKVHPIYIVSITEFIQPFRFVFPCNYSTLWRATNRTLTTNLVNPESYSWSINQYSLLAQQYTGVSMSQLNPVIQPASFLMLFTIGPIFISFTFMVHHNNIFFFFKQPSIE